MNKKQGRVLLIDIGSDVRKSIGVLAEKLSMGRFGILTLPGTMPILGVGIKSLAGNTNLIMTGRAPRTIHGPYHFGGKGSWKTLSLSMN